MPVPKPTVASTFYLLIFLGFCLILPLSKNKYFCGTVEAFRLILVNENKRHIGGCFRLCCPCWLRLSCASKSGIVWWRSWSISTGLKSRSRGSFPKPLPRHSTPP